MGKKHFSSSRLGLLLKCGIQYDYRYNQDKKRPPGFAALVGGGTSKGVETNLLHKMMSGELAEEDAVADATRDEINRRWREEGILLPEKELRNQRRKIKGKAVDNAVQLAKAHRTEFAPRITPIGVEKEFRIEIPDFEYDLYGFMDVQEEDAVRDTKTKIGQSPSGQEAETSIQLDIYGLAHQVMRGKPAREMSLDFLTLLKGGVKPRRLATHRTSADYDRLFRLMERAAEIIGKGVFTPAQPDSWICTPKYCGYWDECPFGRRGRIKK